MPLLRLSIATCLVKSGNFQPHLWWSAVIVWHLFCDAFLVHIGVHSLSFPIFYFYFCPVQMYCNILQFCSAVSYHTNTKASCRQIWGGFCKKIPDYFWEELWWDAGITFGCPTAWTRGTHCHIAAFWHFCSQKVVYRKYFFCTFFSFGKT